MALSVKQRLLILVPLCVVLLLLALFHVWVIGSVLDGDQDGWVSVSATIVSLDENAGAKTPNARVVYEFAVQEQAIRGSSEIDKTTASSLEEGDSVDIRYNPEDVDQSALLEDGGAAMNQLILLLLADVVFVIAAVTGFLRHRKRV